MAACGRSRSCYANRRVEQLTGSTADELVGQSVELLIATDSLELVRRDAARDDLPHATSWRDPRRGAPRRRSRRRSGRSLVVTLRDLSELKAGREAQFEAEAKYRALVEHIPAVVYLDPVDENSDSIYVSPQVRDAARDRARTSGSPIRTAGATTSIPTISTGPGRSTRTRTTHHTTLNHEYRMVHEDGSIRWVLEQAYPIDDEHGNPWLIQGVIFDITERKTRRGAGRVPRLPRQAHRPAEPGAVRGDARERDRPRSPARPRRRRAVPRPRQLQARERLARPPRRRPAARRSSATGCGAARARPTWWRARAATSSCCCWRTWSGAPARSPGPTRRCSSPSPWPTRVHEALQRAVRPGRHGVLRLGLDRHQPVPAGRPATPTTLAEERRRRDVPVKKHGAGRLRRLRDRRRRPDCSSSR